MALPASSAPRTTAHISRDGFREDRDGFVAVKCGCGRTIGPAPDMETALDMAMEHAWMAGRSDVLGSG